MELKMGAQRAVVQKKEERHLGRLNRCSSIQNRTCPGGERPGHGTRIVCSQTLLLYHVHL